MRSFSWEPGMWVFSNQCSFSHYTSWIRYIIQIPDFLCGPRILLPVSKMAGSAPFSVLHPPALTPTLVHHENPRIQQFKCFVLPQLCLTTSFFISTDHQSCITLGNDQNSKLSLLCQWMHWWFSSNESSWHHKAETPLRTSPTQPHDSSFAHPYLLCLRESSHIFPNTSLSSLQLL